MAKFQSPVVIGGQAFKTVTTYPQYGYIKKDWQRTSDNRPRTHGRYIDTIPSVDYIGQKDYKSNVGCPDQMNRYDDLFISLGYDQQWLWMNVCCQALWGKDFNELSPDQRIVAKTQWENLTWNHLCFNNNTGRPDGYDDYVLPFNGWRTEGMEQESIVCSSPDGLPYEQLNIVKIIGDPVPFTALYYDSQDVPKRYLHYPIEVLDVKKPLPLAKDLLNMRWLCHRPSVSTGKKLSVGYQIDFFPHFERESRYILWGLNTTVGYIRCDWIKVF